MDDEPADKFGSVKDPLVHQEFAEVVAYVVDLGGVG